MPASAGAGVSGKTIQTQLFLNWQLRKVTSAEDAQLIDISTGEATAEMGELNLAVSATDDSARAVAASEFEKNTVATVPH